MPGKVVREVNLPILDEPTINDSKQNRMTVEQLLEVHKTLSEELRHTSNVVWRFGVAIATLQLAPFAFIGRKDFVQVTPGCGYVSRSASHSCLV